MSWTLATTINKPEHWSMRPFGRVTRRRQEVGAANAQPLSVFLDDGVVPRSSREDNFNRLGEDLAKYLVVRPGDIVFNKLRTWQGGLGVSGYHGIVSPAYFVCEPSQFILPRYVHYLLRANIYRAELTRISKWMPPSQFDIGWDELRQLPTLVPPLSEQRAIADYLDRETARIDALIAAKRRMEELIQTRLAVAIRKSVTAGPGEPFPVGALRRRWTIVDCKHTTPTYVNSGYPIVSPGDVTPGRLDLGRCTRFVNEEDFVRLTSDGRRPGRGDIIYSRNASIGIASYVDTDAPFSMGQDVCMITSRTEDQRFLTFVLNTIGLDQLDEQKLGSTFSRINVAQIAALAIPTPSAAEQTQIADRLDQLTTIAAATSKALLEQAALLAERRQALITAAVTGALEIPGVAVA